MNRYNPNAKCPACGDEKILASFRKKGSYDYEASSSYIKHQMDVIRRTCNNCGYYWDELPLQE